jgi:hypothetical protein
VTISEDRILSADSVGDFTFNADGYGNLVVCREDLEMHIHNVFTTLKRAIVNVK